MRNFWRLFYTWLILTNLTSGLIHAQSIDEIYDKFIKRYHSYESKTIPYYLFVPATYDSQTPYPLVLCLHGRGESSDDSSAVKKNSMAVVWATDANQAIRPCFILVPICPFPVIWNDLYLVVNDLLDSILTEFLVDTNRIYITGYSAGDPLDWITVYPERFAAAISISGGIDKSKASLIKHIPIWDFHGALDEIISPEASRLLMAALENIGVPVIYTDCHNGVCTGLPDSVIAEKINNGARVLYTEYEYGFHDIMHMAYNNPLLWLWTFLQSKTNQPIFADSVSINRTFIKLSEDTLIISAFIENPNQHNITVLATFTDDSNVVLDSVFLYDDGLHQDGQAGDKVWATSYIYIDNAEQTVHVSISTYDLVNGSTGRLLKAVQFTSIGPLVFDGIKNASSDQEVNAGDYLKFKFKLRNSGLIATAMNISSYVVPLDTCAKITALQKVLYNNIAAGESVEGGSSQYIRFNKYCAGQTSHFALDIYSNNYKFWSDTFSIDIVNGIEEGTDIAVKELSLKQNYPNPFNPSTTISYDLPLPSHVLLQVYDVQGREVTTLVNEKLNAGTHSASWNAAGFASGVYLYRLQVKNYSSTKKLILLR